jgi:hypothetical protein
MKILLSIVAASLLLMGLAAGQEQANETSDTEKQQVEAALKLTREAAAKYEFVVADKEKSPAKLLAEPVLRWSNPAVGEIHGNVFLWTKDTRPIAIGSLFKWFSPHTHTSHEFQSLTDQPLVASYDGRQVWTVKSPGVNFRQIDKAEPPADSSNRRQTQMRQLAKRFRGDMRSREGEDVELRLLTQPIYKYEAAKEGVLEGGLFAFVEGTDPEILLLIEARNDDKGTRWYAAGARMQNVMVRLKLDEAEFWSVQQLAWNVAFDHSQPYTLFDTPGK